MDNWVLLDPGQFALPAGKKSMGLQVTFSPYDLPSAIRCRMNDEKKRLCIEFKYLTEEKTDRREVNDHITALISQRTQRLYGLEIDTEASGVDAVQLECTVRDAVKNAFERLKENSPSDKIGDKYQIAEEAINQNSARLFSFA